MIVNSEDTALEVSGLTVEFGPPSAALRAVENVSFSVQRGETVAVVGESGCGKSVTGLSVMGLLPMPPARVVAGSALLRRRDGSKIDLLPLKRSEIADIRGDEIAMIFQEPMTSLNPLHTVGDQVAEPLIIHRGMSGGAARNRAAELLARVGIPDPRSRLESFPHEMSGGMRQRVMIAMALACEPGVLLADEPTTALDVTIQAQILELFRQLQQSSRMAVIFVTHDFGVVAEVAQRVVVMYAGQIVEQGPVAEVLKRPKHPYTSGLLRSLPRIDRPQRDNERFYAIPGQVPELSRMPAGCRFQPRCAHAVAGTCDASQALEAIGADQTVRCARWRELASLTHA